MDAEPLKRKIFVLVRKHCLCDSPLRGHRVSLPILVQLIADLLQGLLLGYILQISFGLVLFARTSVFEPHPTPAVLLMSALPPIPGGVAQ